VLVAVLSSPASANTTITDELWQDADCRFEVANDFTVGDDVLCGTVTVPERHAEPDGPTITLSVAIFKAHGESPAPDPLALFSGGPGANIFDLAPRKRSGAIASTLATRDIVLMSERGTYGADPILDCPELAILDENFGIWGPKRNALELQAYTECHERLFNEGVDFDAFTNPERAADVPYVMEVLGYETYNIWGVSGGGLLTQLVVRNHPDGGVRTIMTDSGAFPTADFRDIFAPLFTNMSSRYRRLFEECAADAGCSRDFPDLEKVFFDLVADLNTDPAPVAVTNPTTGEEVEVMLTGDVFIAVLSNTFSLISMVPKMIFDVADGDYDLLNLFLPGAYAGDNGIGTADALYMSMICPEMGRMTMDDIATGGTIPEIVEALSPRIQLFFDICSVWDVPLLPPGDVVVSDVPALIMEGVYDTNKPPEYGAEVAANFSTSYLVEFGDKAHVVLGECAISIMAEFMNDPYQPPDTSCVAASVTFSGPAGLMWWIVYNNLKLVIAGVVVLLVAAIAGIVWFIRRRKARSKAEVAA